MAVTKRARFEVLRRDQHTCQYCGEKAPDVVLQVDHVVPVALGGSDAPSNLLTACRDCNSGKSSIPSEAPTVAAVSDRSLQWALAAKNRMAHIEADMRAMGEYEEAFLADWQTYTYRQGIKDVHVPLPTDWRATLKGWWRIDVPKALIESAVETAMGAKSVNMDGRFPYFCGVVWRTLDTYDQRYPQQTAEAPVYGPDDLLESESLGFRVGYDSGHRRGSAEALAQFEDRDVVRRFIDGELAGVA